MTPKLREPKITAGLAVLEERPCQLTDEISQQTEMKISTGKNIPQLLQLITAT